MAKIVNANASWTDGERFVVSASSGHAFVVDADRERNTGPGPMELVLIGLCACTATDVVGILRKKREPFTSLEVRAEGERAQGVPSVYEHVKLIYRVGGNVQKKSMEDAVKLSKEKYCSVSAMLQKSVKISFEIEYA
jgi:putative redox protein